MDLNEIGMGFASDYAALCLSLVHKRCSFLFHISSISAITHLSKQGETDVAWPMVYHPRNRWSCFLLS